MKQTTGTSSQLVQEGKPKPKALKAISGLYLRGCAGIKQLSQGISVPEEKGLDDRKCASLREEVFGWWNPDWFGTV